MPSPGNRVHLLPFYDTVMAHYTMDPLGNPFQVLIATLSARIVRVRNNDTIELLLQQLELRNPTASIEEMEEVAAGNQAPVAGGEVFDHAASDAIEKGERASTLAYSGPHTCQVTRIVAYERHSMVVK